MPAGRPSTYSEEMADDICELIAEGNSLVRICKMVQEAPDYSTVMRWLRENETFRENYARAREDQADYLAAETLDIADNCTDPAKARLQLDARKWYASKLAPKKYGDKVEQTVQGPDGKPLFTWLPPQT